MIGCTLPKDDPRPAVDPPNKRLPGGPITRFPVVSSLLLVFLAGISGSNKERILHGTACIFGLNGANVCCK